MNSNQPSWGTYAPPKSARFLRILIAMGLGRGKIRKRILASWNRQFGRVVDITIRGVNYRLDIEDNVTDGKILASSNLYDKEELDALSAACRQGVFVDIGANIGYYTLFLATHSECRVLAIEPNPPTLARLRFNVVANNLQDRVHIIPLGIGPEGEFELFSTGDLGSASLHDNPDADTHPVTIKTQPLLDVIQDAGIDKIGALKIDIEGMEDRALAPFIQEAPRTLLPECIVLEHGHLDLWEQDLFAILHEKGYEISFKTRGNTVLNLNTIA